MKKKKSGPQEAKKAAMNPLKKSVEKPAKKPARKVSKKKSTPKAAASKGSLKEKEIGFVEHYFGHITVAAVKLTKGPLSVGDQIHIKGHTSNFFQPVDSIQIDHVGVQKAAKGKDIGVKVKEHARENDKVYLVKAEPEIRGRGSHSA